ncbi:hypothetical protein FACS1894152_7430 [Bacilli bacterium]|nr:hypothetical protein FACS1894152_7430 [Bacilli bacterium]
MRKQLFALSGLRTEELKARWHDIFKTPPPYYSRPILIKDLAYKIQSLYYSDVPSNDELKQNGRAAKKKLTESSGDSQKVTILPPVGTVIKKEYRGSEYLIKILGDGNVEYNGAIYRSLSALAFKITGTKWNGKVFFGLVKNKKEVDDLIKNVNEKKDNETTRKEDNETRGKNSTKDRDHKSPSTKLLSIKPKGLL